MHSKEEKLEAFSRLLDIMDRLREECPWDRKQTFESLRCNTIEEAYELSEALLNNDKANICKELGDVLLHIVFYSRIGSETGDFDIVDVCNRLCEKLIYRHPHVFGAVEVSNAEQVVKNWEELKLKEKEGNKTVLGGVPNSLPALIKACRIQEKACSVGFDWEEKHQVWNKVQEEVNELQTEINHMDLDQMEGEFGDVFFSLINAARLYNINPENALERTNKKFIARFNYIEQKARVQGRLLKDMTLAEMDKLWEEAKQLAR